MYLKTTVYYTNLLHYTVPAYRAHTRSARAGALLVCGATVCVCEV